MASDLCTACQKLWLCWVQQGAWKQFQRFSRHLISYPAASIVTHKPERRGIMLLLHGKATHCVVHTAHTVHSMQGCKAYVVKDSAFIRGCRHGAMADWQLWLMNAADATGCPRAGRECHTRDCQEQMSFGNYCTHTAQQASQSAVVSPLSCQQAVTVLVSFSTLPPWALGHSAVERLSSSTCHATQQDRISYISDCRFNTSNNSRTCLGCRYH